MDQVQEIKKGEGALPGKTEKMTKPAVLLSAKVWELVRINLLFLVFCIPVLTIPASFAAMTKVFMIVVRDGDTNIWKDFWKEFKSGFLKSTAAGFLMGVLLGAFVYIGYAIYISNSGLAGALALAFAIVPGILIYFAGCYLFPLMVTVDLTFGQCIRNAFLLAMAEIKINLLLLIPLILLIASFLVLPYSFPLLLFVMFALCQQTVCNTVNNVIQKRIIDPYYREGMGK